MSDTELFYYKNGNQIFPLQGRKKVLCTSPLNGGITTHLTALMNINCLGGRYDCEMLGETYEEDLAAHVQKNGLDPKTTAALSTAAWTEHAASASESYRELTVTAVATGGIDHNGMRVGDPAGYAEIDGSYELLPPGTINLFLFVNQNLTDAALLRALVVCGEAKAAAVQELLLGSCFSEDLSTGSGTDGVILIADLDSQHTLTDASGHSKLGEMIGNCVKRAVKQALQNLSAASPARQFQLLKRLGRFGVTIGSLWEFYEEHQDYFASQGASFSGICDLERIFEQYNQNSNAVLVWSLYAHLLDQHRWGLIMESETVREGRKLLLNQLHIKEGTYLKDCYPAEAAKTDTDGITPKEILFSYLLLFLAAKR